MTDTVPAPDHPEWHTRTDALISRLDALLLHLKRPPVAAQDALWTYQDIADWLQIAPETVARRVVTRPDFPPPLQPCAPGVNAGKRWFAGEVIKWARHHRRRLPVSRSRRPAQSSRPATSDAVAL